MSLSFAERVADALLFDAVLHPARDPFAIGALAPRAAGPRFFAEARALVTLPLDRLDVRIRLLQHQSVVVEAVAGAELVGVPVLAEQTEHDELLATHHDVAVDVAALLDAGARGVAVPFVVDGATASDPVADAAGTHVGRVVRRRLELHGVLHASLVRVDDEHARLVLRIENDTPFVAPGTLDLLRQSTMFAVHVLVRATDGAFSADRGGDLAPLFPGGTGALFLATPFAPREQEANARVLVAGVGDVDFGDDAVGLQIAHRLVDEAALPRDVSVIEAGASALEVIEHLGPRAELLLLVGAVPRGGPPGTVYAVDAQMLDVARTDDQPSTPASILHALSDLATPLPKVVVVGVEPVQMASGQPLSQPVEDAIPNAISLLLDVIGHSLRDRELEREEPSHL